MANPRPPSLAETPRGWRAFRSDAGRLWATREKPLSNAEEAADVWRTVDADDELQLCQRIAEQEAHADLAVSP